MEVKPLKPTIYVGLIKSGQRVTGVILLLLVFGLLVFPLVSALNDFITQIVFNIKGYKLIASMIVPIEVRWMVVILRFLGVDGAASGEYVLVAGTQAKLVEIIWNCIDWQLLVMFLVTSVVVLQRRFTVISKLKTLLLGIVGTILINILRITLVILL